MKKYRSEKLIRGEDLKEEYKGLVLVAPPISSQHTFMVTFGHEYMIVKKHTKPLEVRTFHDKFGKDKNYRLYYFIWKPTTPKAVQNSWTPEGLSKVVQAFKDSQRRRV